MMILRASAGAVSLSRDRTIVEARIPDSGSVSMVIVAATKSGDWPRKVSMSPRRATHRSRTGWSFHSPPWGQARSTRV
jgi:hypothetical protein